MIKLFWDLDGTLVDSMPVIARCLNKTQSHYGQPQWAFKDLQPLIGPELAQGLKQLLSLTTQDDINDAVAVYRSFYQTDILNSPLFMGIQDILHYFREHGVEQFVATAKYQHFAEQIITGLGLQTLFAGVYGSTETGLYGDKKQLLAHILAEENLNPAEVIMIGDTRFDIEAGLHNNITTVAVSWGYGDPESVQASKPHYTVDRPEQLIDIIKLAATCTC